MRIFLCISSLAAGGAERVMAGLANRWRAQDHSVSLCTTHDRGRAPHYALAAGIELVSADPGVRGFVGQAEIIRRIRALVHDAGPDVVISFLNYTNVLTLAATVRIPVPVIVSERLDPRIIGIGPLWSLARRATYRRAALLVAQTQTAARLYESLAPGRVRVIPNPVEPFPDDDLAPDDTAGDDRPFILAVGRLQYQKGYDVALKAIAGLPPEFADWRLVVLGEGPLRSSLERLRDELGLGARVEFRGTVNDTRPWLRRAGLYLLPSRSEGFPNALCEAMAAGLPVVATDCPSGPAEIITPEVDGLLVPPEDPAAMSTALARLLASAELRSRLGPAATSITGRFGVDAVQDSWTRVINEVLDRAHRRRD